MCTRTPCAVFTELTFVFLPGANSHLGRVTVRIRLNCCESAARGSYLVRADTKFSPTFARAYRIGRTLLLRDTRH